MATTKRKSPLADERLQELLRRNVRSSLSLFGDSNGNPSPEDENVEDAVERNAQMLKIKAKFNLNFRSSNEAMANLREWERKNPPDIDKSMAAVTSKSSEQSKADGANEGPQVITEENAKEIERTPETKERDTALATGHQLMALSPNSTAAGDEKTGAKKIHVKTENPAFSNALAIARDRPEWHPPWKLYRVLMGHMGWVRSVAIDPANEWFCTGAADRTIKIWDLASGKLKLTLTGHIGAVRGLCVSDRHPYMFSVGDDKEVKCWDLEYNKVIRKYHGHLSGVYSAALHPSLDILVTGGRDATVRVWDMRTKAQIFALGGHRDAVNSLQTQKVDPQIISGSADGTIRLWDLAAGRCSSTLTNHKKGVRAVACNPREFSFASASADNIKTWRLPRGDFMRNLSGHNVIINSLSVNEDGVMVSGGDDGSLGFWDYKSAHEFYRTQTQVQPGSLDCEAGIFGSAFDMTGTRLITVETDKSIKMWKEDQKATPESHPLNWKPNVLPKRY